MWPVIEKFFSLEDIRTSKYRRRQLFILAGLLIGSLLAIRYGLVPWIFSSTRPSAHTILVNVLDALLSSTLATFLVVAVLIALVPPPEGESALRIVPSRDLREVLENAMESTSEWWYRGHGGRYFRSVTLPRLSERAGADKRTKRLVVQILDPTDAMACRACEEYINRFRIGTDQKKWTVYDVKRESYVTVLAAYVARSECPFLDITVNLHNRVSLFRVDMSSSVAVLSFEQTSEPALAFGAGESFYEMCKEDLEISRFGTRELDTTIQLSLPSVDEDSVRDLFTNLDIGGADLSDELLQDVVSTYRTLEDPYA